MERGLTQYDLVYRLRRIHSAMRSSQEFDMSKLPAKAFQNPIAVGFEQNFSGDFSEHELANVANSVIHNIASLGDHLNRWAAKNPMDKAKIKRVLDNSMDLKLLTDLWDNDKHGYPRRGSSFSGKNPKLKRIGRVMKLTLTGPKGSRFKMTIGSGIPEFHGDGTACAIITGDIVDADGVRIDDLFNVQQRAIKALEALLEDIGMQPLTSRV